jgi:hypothetical protein
MKRTKTYFVMLAFVTNCAHQGDFYDWLENAANMEMAWPANDLGNVATSFSGQAVAGGQYVLLTSSKTHNANQVKASLKFKQNGIEVCLADYNISASSYLQQITNQDGSSTYSMSSPKQSIRIEAGKKYGKISLEMAGESVNRKLEPASVFIIKSTLLNDTAYSAEFENLQDETGLKSSAKFGFRTEKISSGAPRLQSVGLSATNLTSGQSLSVSMQTDISAYAAYITLQSPSGKNYSVNQSINPNAASFAVSFPIQAYHESGSWKVSSLQIYGTGGTVSYSLGNSASKYNMSSGGAAVVSNIDIPYFTVSGTTGDLASPNYASASFTPAAVSAASSLLVQISASDAASGISSGSAWLCSPSGKQMGGSLTYNSGTSRWEMTVNFQGYEENGTFKLCLVYLQDNAGNYKYYNLVPAYSATNYIAQDYPAGTVSVTGLAVPQLTVSGLLNDVVPPVLVNIAGLPGAAAVGSTLSFGIQTSDAVSKTSSVSVTFSSPGSRAGLTYASNNGYFYTSSLDTSGYGALSGVLNIMDPGYWEMNTIVLADKNQNSRTYFSLPGKSNYHYSSGGTDIDSGIAVVGFNKVCN